MNQMQFGQEVKSDKSDKSEKSSPPKQLSGAEILTNKDTPEWLRRRIEGNAEGNQDSSKDPKVLAIYDKFSAPPRTTPPPPLEEEGGQVYFPPPDGTPLSMQSPRRIERVFTAPDPMMKSARVGPQGQVFTDEEWERFLREGVQQQEQEKQDQENKAGQENKANQAKKHEELHRK